MGYHVGSKCTVCWIYSSAHFTGILSAFMIFFMAIEIKLRFKSVNVFVTVREENNMKNKKY